MPAGIPALFQTAAVISAKHTLILTVVALLYFGAHASKWSGIEVSSVQVATPDQAQEVHAFIRKWLADKVSTNVSSSIRIIYGERLTIPHWPARHNKQLF